MSGFFIWAHRGASSEAPENTLAAFRAAEASGADGIELDVHLSRDGVPVVLHDDTVERTTDGRGEVRRLTVRQLKELDAGSWFGPAFAGEPIPTLEEVLAWAEDRLRLNVEIKSEEAGRTVLDLVGAFPAARLLISSFDHRLLARLRAADSALPLGFLCDSLFWRSAVRRAAAGAAESFHPRRNLLSRPLVAACRRAGLAVFPWTVDRPEEIRLCRRLGVDGIFTNAPRAARQAGPGCRPSFPDPCRDA